MNLNAIKDSDKILDTELDYIKNSYMDGRLKLEDYERQTFKALERYNDRVKNIFTNK